MGSRRAPPLHVSCGRLESLLEPFNAARVGKPLVILLPIFYLSIYSPENTTDLRGKHGGVGSGQPLLCYREQPLLSPKVHRR
ncbi:hypothetical protein PIB30_011519 [Stylosanthes scabra]|uniref:Uncharacterized protein n=1 Tax=Stylosanthes scabra TaxID=79078 RepID=A0ABU6T5P4_9FABA|nr:hypothetical protein [Stylosanthes scabra]